MYIFCIWRHQYIVEPYTREAMAKYNGKYIYIPWWARRMIQYNHHPSLGNVIFFSLVSHMLLDLAPCIVNDKYKYATSIQHIIFYHVFCVPTTAIVLFC